MFVERLQFVVTPSGVGLGIQKTISEKEKFGLVSKFCA
jgi:hypothetical protein